MLRASRVANDCGSDSGADVQETRSDAQRVAASLLAVVCRRFMIKSGFFVAKLLGRIDLPGFLVLIYIDYSNSAGISGVKRYKGTAEPKTDVTHTFAAGMGSNG